MYMYIVSYHMCYECSVEIAHTMTKALHFNTYGGNPMACAVGSAVLDVSMHMYSVYMCVYK